MFLCERARLALGLGIFAGATFGRCSVQKFIGMTLSQQCSEHPARSHEQVLPGYVEQGVSMDINQPIAARLLRAAC